MFTEIITIIKDTIIYICKNNIVVKKYNNYKKHKEQKKRIINYIYYIADDSERKQIVSRFYDSQIKHFVRNSICDVYYELHVIGDNIIDSCMFTKTNNYYHNNRLLNIDAVNILNSGISKGIITIDDNTYITNKDIYYKSNNIKYFHSL